MSSKPELIRFDWCRCQWKEKCTEVQKQLATYCFQTDKGHPQLGYLWVRKEQVALRNSLEKHLSFTVLLSRIQRNDWAMRYHVIPKLPSSIQSSDPNLFHLLLVDTLGSFFRHEFLKTLDAMKKEEEDERGITIESVTVYEKQKLEEKEAKYVQVNPEGTAITTDMASHVHRFLGYAVSATRNVIASEEESRYGFYHAVHERILDAMTTTCEDLIQKILVDKNTSALEMYPKFIHMKFSAALRGGKVRVLVSEPFFEFGRALIENLQNLVNEETLVKEGESFSQAAWERLKKSDILWDRFEKAVRSEVGREILEMCSNDRELVAEHMLDVVELLIHKTLIAYSGCFADRIKEKRTSRRNAKRTSDYVSFRGDLKNTCGPASKKNKTISNKSDDK